MRGDIYVDITILHKYPVNFNLEINFGSSITQDNQLSCFCKTPTIDFDLFAAMEN